MISQAMKDMSLKEDTRGLVERVNRIEKILGIFYESKCEHPIGRRAKYARPSNVLRNIL